MQKQKVDHWERVCSPVSPCGEYSILLYAPRVLSSFLSQHQYGRVLLRSFVKPYRMRSTYSRTQSPRALRGVKELNSLAFSIQRSVNPLIRNPG